ncbi:MAG: sulfotransferase [Longimonas sp.]|uniref:sulfotransferase family protein n=1 Tax=Longimonas sp. TaxID=2039626 RepID=UPI0039760137
MLDSDESSSAPIFVVGASRSGTTLLRLMLNAHPSIAIPDELSYFSLVGTLPTPWNAPLDAGRYVKLVDGFLDQNEPVLTGVDRAALRRAMLTHPAHTIRTPYAVALDHWATAQSKPIWGEKTPHNFFFVPELHEMFPSARFIHLVRDPRAAVHSMNGFKRCVSNTVINATNWRTFMQQGAAVLEATVPAHQRITIRFEDLTSNPDFVLQQLCSFLDISFHSDMLSFHETSHQYMHPVFEKLGGAQTVTRPVNTDTKARWTTEMAPADIATVEHICGPWLPIFSYERRTDPLSWTERLRRAPDMAYCALKRWQHRDARVHLMHYNVPWAPAKIPKM